MRGQKNCLRNSPKSVVSFLLKNTKSTAISTLRGFSYHFLYPYVLYDYTILTHCYILYNIQYLQCIIYRNIKLRAKYSPDHPKPWILNTPRHQIATQMMTVSINTFSENGQINSSFQRYATSNCINFKFWFPMLYLN